jgi:hypothetical protein
LNEGDDALMMVECAMDDLTAIKETWSTRKAYGWVPAIADGAVLKLKA